MKDQDQKNKRLENNFETIKISINDVDKFEKKRSNKEENIYKNILYDWLINYIPEPIKNL